MKTIEAILLKPWTPCRRVKIGSVIEVPENLYTGALEKGIIGAVEAEPKTLSQMNVAELEVIAADESIDFTDCKNKKERVAAIEAKREAIEKEIADAEKAGQEKADADKDDGQNAEGSPSDDAE